MNASGFTIDSRTNAASGMFAFFASVAGALSRSGPILPVVPAGWNVWQLPQPFAAKTVLPSAVGDAAAVVVGAAAAVVVGVAAVVVAPAVMVTVLCPV